MTIITLAISLITSGLRPIKLKVLPKSRLNMMKEISKPRITPMGLHLPPSNEVESTIGKMDKIQGDSANSNPSTKAALKSSGVMDKLMIVSAKLKLATPPI